ncbi:VWA domain-containing protein [Rhodococcus xishaensis]|uniref:VWA domain-containing protein n=1 Tax=Rhodococcus xishaensis TaxID=2487364 RepID=A0A3S3AGX8_9NOCA|nr:VWA domain-containing protein [Rhodococcus xishaensis]
MGRHRNDRRFRGVSKGPIISAVTVIVLVLGVIGWFQLKDRTSSQGTAAAGACVEGDATLVVAADPDIAGPLRELAARFTETRPVIRDHCVSVSVHDADSAAVTGTLSAAPQGPWNADLGPAPALWIPATGEAVNRLSGTGAIDGQPKSVAFSPVVVAVPQELGRALTEARINWQNLPALQSGTDTLAEVGLDGWGSLKLALPTGTGSGATTSVLDAVAAATATVGTGPLDAAQAASPRVTTAIAALANSSTAIEGAPASTPDALTALANQNNPAQAPFHAVPATEQQIYAAGERAQHLVAFAPSGATPVADHPAAILAAPWVDETLSRAAAQFLDFLSQPEQVQDLVDAGFRVGDKTPPSTDWTPMPPLVQVLAPATGPAATQLAETFASPVIPQATTILLDISGSMGDNDGTGTRMSNTVGALSERIAALPNGSDVGLWVYSRGLNGSEPYRIEVPTGPMDENDRRERLETALRSLRPATATSTYASLIAAHESAVDGFVEGRPNSILLITDGPNDDTSTTREQLTSALTRAVHPVRIDVVSIDDNSDQETLQAVADQTGGTLIAVPSTQGPAIGGAFGELLL